MSEALKEKYETQPILNHELATRDDTATWLAEALDGSMRSEFSYRFDGLDLIARDGRALKPIFMDAIEDARDKTEHDPSKHFELRRREIELQEYDDIIAMAKGDTPNTLIVVSDFPEELESSQKDIGGYNVTRKQAMLRVITREDNGEIKMVSQSLDRSDRRGLEKLYKFVGEEAMPGELLEQRIALNLDSKIKDKLPETLTRVYDNHLQDYYGGEWYAGRRGEDRRNTFEFANMQQDLLQAFFAGPRDQSATYNLAAAIQGRFDSKSWHEQISISAFNNPDRPMLSVIMEMEQQGRRARAEGRDYSGCGSTISMGSEEELSNLGYGDSDKKSDDGEMKCVNCPECKTFHHKVRKVGNKPVCDNAECKLSDKKT